MFFGQGLEVIYLLKFLWCFEEPLEDERIPNID